MVRRTSINAYHKIETEGLLSKRKWQVYKALFQYGPATGSELFRYMHDHRNPTHSNVVTRLGELRDMGCVMELTTRRCEVSGQNVIVWDVTDRVPIKLEKRETSRQKILKLELALGWYANTGNHPIGIIDYVSDGGKLARETLGMEIAR